MLILLRIKCDPPNNSPPAPHYHHDDLLADSSDRFDQCRHQKKTPAVKQDSNQYVHEDQDKRKQCRANIREARRDRARAAVQGSLHEVRKNPAPDTREEPRWLIRRHGGNRCLQGAAISPRIASAFCLPNSNLAVFLERTF
jgi:hypothetical protein